MSEAFTLRMLAAEAYNYSINEISTRINRLEADSLTSGLDFETWVEQLASDFLLEPLEWDESRPVEYDRDVVISASNRESLSAGDPIRRLILPVIYRRSNPRVLTLRPEKSWTQRGPSPGTAAAYVESDAIIVLRGTKDDLSNMLETTKTLVRLINDDVHSYFGNLRPTVLGMLHEKRQRLIFDDEGFQREARQLGAEVRRRTGEPGALRRPSDVRDTNRDRRSHKQITGVDAQSVATPPDASTSLRSRHSKPQDTQGPQIQPSQEEKPAAQHRTGLNPRTSSRQAAELVAFIAYAHSDARYLERFREHLSPLRREHLLADWDDRNIAAGQNWEAEIDVKLGLADLVFLLISPAFISSEYCYGREVRMAMERHTRGESLVIPVVIRPVDWTKTPLGRLQAVPRDGKPITSWSPQDAGWLDAILRIREAINYWLGPK